MTFISSKSAYRSKLNLFVLAGGLLLPPLIPTLVHAKPNRTKARPGTITIAGIVTRDTPGNDFYVRSDEGDRFLVVSANQPAGVDTGVRVKVTGYYDGNQISAQSIGVLKNKPSDNNPSDNSDDERMLNVTGVVTRDPAGNDFYIRSDDDRTYLVITKSQPEAVQTGVRVRVVGWYDGDHLNANDVDVLGADDNFDRNRSGFNRNGKSKTITGVVTRDTPGNDFYVRTDGGDNYLIITQKQPSGIESGVRVKVKGWSNGDQISADEDDIDILENSGWNTKTQQGNLDVKGVVTKDPQGNDFYIRDDDDQTYLVITKSQDKGVKKGARVRVRGWFDGDHLNANDVDVLKKAGNSSGINASILGGKARYLTIVGNVTRLSKRDFWVRDSLGFVYTVTTIKKLQDLEVGDRVQVFGYYSGSVLIGNSIKILNKN